MKKAVLMALCVAMVAATAQAAFIVESRTGGQNFANYSELNAWSNSSGKSTVPDVTAGIGSRYGSTYFSVVGLKEATFTADLDTAGQYEVFVTWGANSNRKAGIQYRVVDATGTTTLSVDQSATANTWVSLGTYTFNAGTAVGSVTVSNVAVNLSGSMYADAAKWVYIPEPAALALLGLGSLLFVRRRRTA